MEHDKKNKKKKFEENKAVIESDRILLTDPLTIETNDERGEKGTFTYDENYLNICVDRDTWKRIKFLEFDETQVLEESDPIFIESEAYNITATDITNLSNLSGTNTGDQDLSGLVPYTGATSDVNLGTRKIKADSFLFNDTTGFVYYEGDMGIFNGGWMQQETIKNGETSFTTTFNVSTYGLPHYIYASNLSGTNTGDQESSDFNLADLSDVDKTNKATGKIIQVKSDGNHEYVDLPNPDLSGYFKLDQTTPQTITDGTPIFSNGLSVNADNEKIILGTGNDTELYFDGSNQIHKTAGYHYFYTNGTNYPLTIGTNSGTNKITSAATLSIMAATVPSSLDTGLVLLNASDTIDFYTGGSIKLKLGSLSGNTAFYPNAAGLSLGGSSKQFYNLFIDNIAYIDEIRQDDNEKHYFGTANDANIYYDATNLIINPKAVGSGILDVQGVVQTDGYNSSDGSAGVSGSFTTTDGKTITIKDGLVTAIV